MIAHTWLDVTMNHIPGVHVIQRGADTRDVKGHVALLKEQLLAQIVPQVAPSLKIEHDVAVVTKHNQTIHVGDISSFTHNHLFRSNRWVTSLTHLGMSCAGTR